VGHSTARAVERHANCIYLRHINAVDYYLLFFSVDKKSVQ